MKDKAGEGGGDLCVCVCVCVCVYGKEQAGTLRAQLSSSSRLPCVTDSLRGRGTFNSLEEQTHTDLGNATTKTYNSTTFFQDVPTAFFAHGVSPPFSVSPVLIPFPHTVSLPPAMATLASLLPAPRGIDLSLPTCGETQCNSRGTCVSPPGGGVNLLCDCILGYMGESCEDTVNGELSVPLTLGVLAAIIGVLILAFIIAKIRQCQKKNRRRNAAKKFGQDVVV